MIQKYCKYISLTAIGAIITILAGCSSSTGNNTDIFDDLTTNPTPALAATATNSTVTTPITITRADVSPVDANDNTNTITIGTGGTQRSYTFNSRAGESVFSEINTGASTGPNQMQILSTQSAGNQRYQFARITTFIEGRGLGTGTTQTITHLTQALTGTQVASGDYTQPTQEVIYNGQYNITSTTQANNSNGMFTLNVDFTPGTLTASGTTTTNNGVATGTFAGGTVSGQQINGLGFTGTGTGALVVSNMQTRIYGPNAEEIAGIGTTTTQNSIFSFIGAQE